MVLATVCVASASAQSPGADTAPDEDAGSKANYPEFRWDHIPLYMHIRKDTAYTDQEIEFLARFPLITFEKANGHKQFGSVEQGTLVAARAVKRVNPRVRILYYRNVVVHYGGYAANEQIEQIPGALLKDANGNTQLVRNRVEAYDLSNPELRAWWVRSCLDVVADPAIDGVFIDGNVKALEPGYLVREIGPEKKRQTTDGYHLLMKQTRQTLGADKLIVANLLRARFADSGLEHLSYFDGSYLENFFHNVGTASYEEYVAQGIEAMQTAARQGKILAFTTSLAAVGNASTLGIDESHGKVATAAEAQSALAYPLAVFLIAAEKYSYFRVHEGYSANEGPGWMRWFPEYDRPLGPPQGPAVRRGLVYTRKYEHADVVLDLGRRQGEVKWR